MGLGEGVLELRLEPKSMADIGPRCWPFCLTSSLAFTHSSLHSFTHPLFIKYLF